MTKTATNKTYVLNKARERFRQHVKSIEPTGSDDVESYFIVDIAEMGEVSFSYSVDSWTDTLLCMNQFSNDYNYSLKRLEQSLDLAVVSILRKFVRSVNFLDTPPDELIDDRFNWLVDRIQTPHVALIPISGLSPEYFREDSIMVGPIMLCKYFQNKGPLVDWIKRNQRGHQSTEGDSTTKYVHRDFKEAGFYAQVSNLYGDFDTIQSQAKERTWGLLNVMKLFLDSSSKLFNPAYKRLSIAGRHGVRGWEQVLVFSNDETHGAGHSHSGHGIADLHFNPGMVRNWQQKGFERVLDRVLEPKTPVDKRIQRSTQWYGNSLDANSREESFVAMAIALESLLVAEESGNKHQTWGSITQTLAERVAFLIGTGLENRLKLVKDMKTMYDKRSKVVHKAEAEITQEELEYLDRIASETIIAFAMQYFNKWEEFTKWVDERKFETKRLP